MEVDDDGKILACVGGFRREEEAEPEVPGGVDYGVGGGYAVRRFGGGRAFEIHEAEETAVDGAVTAETGIDDGVCDGERKSEHPWKIRRCSGTAAGGSGHFLALVSNGKNEDTKSRNKNGHVFARVNGLKRVKFQKKIFAKIIFP